MADQASVSGHAGAPQNAAAPEPVSQRRMLPRVIGARRAGLLAAGALALIGLIFAWQASLLDLGQIGLPGPGFFPLLLGGLLVVFSAVIAIEGRLDSSKDELLELGHPQVLITFAALLAVPLLFDLLGAFVPALAVWFVAALAIFVVTDALLTAARVYRLFWYTPLVRLALFIYFFCGIAMIASMR